MPNYQNVKALFLYINLAENFTNRNSIAFVASSQNLTFANMCNCEATTSPKLYPSTLEIDLILWHTQLIVCE